jgi:hypothetical protein
LIFCENHCFGFLGPFRASPDFEFVLFQCLFFEHHYYSRSAGDEPASTTTPRPNPCADQHDAESADTASLGHEDVRDVYGDTAAWYRPGAPPVNARLSRADIERLKRGPVGQSLRVTHILCIVLFIFGYFLLAGGARWPWASAPLQCVRGEAWERCFLRERLGVNLGGVGGAAEDDGGREL